MIIKGRSRKDGGQLASYLLREHNQQRVVVMDQRGTAADDLSAVFQSWEATAYALSRARKPLYHVQIRLPKGEALHDAQWLETLDRLEKRLKMQDQPRVVVKHILNGEAHLHVAYSRFDDEHGRLVKMSHDARSHHTTAREMEREFGLREVDSTPKRERTGNQRTRSLEHKMAKEAGTSRQAVCAIVRAAWEGSRTGREFQDRLARFGMEMTPGKRRDYVVEHNRKEFNPVRLLDGVKAAEFRAKMEMDPPRFAEYTVEKENARARRKRGQRDTDHSPKAQSEPKKSLPTDANALVANLNRQLTERRRTERDRDVV